METIKDIGVIVVMALMLISVANAQMMQSGMMTNNTTTAANPEEAAGKALWDNLKTGQVTCNTLADKDFDLLGEYFMGTMMGASHEAMNSMLKQSFGDTGESQMHVVLGKRMSGCNTTAAYPAGFSGFMPMMGNWPSLTGYYPTNNMMNFGYGFGPFGWIFMLLWWALVIIVVIAFVRWLQRGKGGNGRSALGILNERYAKGEIDKKEFEEKKKDLASH